jgi:hypothetical protein
MILQRILASSSPDIPPELFLVVGFSAGAIMLCIAINKKRMQRLMADLPTSRTDGVFIGFNELKGKTRCDRALTSFLAEAACVHYRYSVEEHWSRMVTESYTDSKGKRRTRTRRESGWKTVSDDEQMVRFRLQDESGEIRILPQGAKIDPSRIFSRTCGRGNPLYYGKGPRRAVSDSDHRRRFTEYGITLDTPIYVLGQARERSDMVAAEIAADREAPHFLISTRSEEELRERKRGGYWGLSIFGLVFTVGGLMLHDQWRYANPGRIPEYLLAGGSYLLIWLISWIWMATNSLISLKNRAEQAKSLIDVQVLRRHDLIPQLVECVNAISKHEKGLQSRLAELRYQQKLDWATPFPDSEPLLTGLLEAYPELHASEAYLGLHQELIDTENRIALARNYYNEIASFYNTRQEIFPDRLLGRMLGEAQFKLLGAEREERDPVDLALKDSAGFSEEKIRGKNGGG